MFCIGDLERDDDGLVCAIVCILQVHVTHTSSVDKDDELAVVDDELCVHVLAEESKTSTHVGTASSAYGGSMGGARAYENDVIVDETVIHVEEPIEEIDEDIAEDNETNLNDEGSSQDKQLLHRLATALVCVYMQLTCSHLTD